MYAVLIEEDRSLVWGQVPEPARKPDELLIDVHAAGVNRADLLQRAGRYPPPPGWPQWMGLEVAGVVAEAPQDGRWRVGDRVCALLGGGGYAERVAVPADLALPVPDGLSLIAAAALPEAFATAYLNLCLEGGLKAGDTVLVQAGASGVGLAAIQLVKARGGTVVTTVGTADKAAFVRKLGADVVIDRTRGDLIAVLDEHPVDIALDCIGGPALGAYLAKMAHGGRWIVIATLGGARVEIDLNTVFLRGVKLIGSTLRSRPLETKARILASLEREVWPLFATGKIQPIIHKTLALPQAERAHAILERRENIGKVILTRDGAAD